MLDAADLRLRLIERGTVLFLTAEFHQGVGVGESLLGVGKPLELGLRVRQRRGYLLGRVGVVPESRGSRPRLQIVYLASQRVNIERLGNRLVLCTSITQRLGKIKLCHHHHHTFRFISISSTTPIIYQVTTCGTHI